MVWFSPVLLSSSWPSFQPPSLAKIQPSLLVYSISESLVSRLQVHSPKSIDYIWTPPPTTVNDQSARKGQRGRAMIMTRVKAPDEPQICFFFLFLFTNLNVYSTTHTTSTDDSLRRRPFHDGHEKGPKSGRRHLLSLR